MPISVLYIHSSGIFGGASRSLLEMIKAFPERAVVPYVLTQKGNVVDFCHSEGIQTLPTLGIAQFDNTRYGFYRGYRWLILLREFFYSFFTLYALARARLQWKHIDLIHVNEITMLFPIIVARLLFQKPLVVHVRSVQQHERARWRARFVTCVLKHCADAVVAIDQTVAQSLSPDLSVHVVHNGFLRKSPLQRGEKPDQPPYTLSEPSMKVAMMGNLLLMKGVHEFLQAARLCKEKGLRIHFILVGGNTHTSRSIKEYFLKKLRFAQDVSTDVTNIIRQYRLEDVVHVVGFTPNIQEIYDNIDVLCFPSYLNAVGRPVFEAAFSKVPSIVAITQPLADTIVHGETGLCIEPKNALALADAIEYFYRQPADRARMGALAYQLALKNFDMPSNARKILEIYRKCVAISHPGAKLP